MLLHHARMPRLRRFPSDRVASGGWCPGVSGMDTSLRLCISDSPTLVCSARGVGWLGGGIGKLGCGRVLDGGQSEGGGVCAARMLRKSGTLKVLRAQDYRRDKCLGL